MVRNVCSRPTFYRHLKKLARKGDVIESGYRLAREEREADPKQVADCIKNLKETESPTTLKAFGEVLETLCNSKRIAHRRNVLNFLESAIRDPKYENPEVLSRLIRYMYMILLFEKLREAPDDGIINRMKKEENLYRTKDLIKKYTDKRILLESLFFLGETEAKEAVDIVFRIAKRLLKRELASYRFIS